MDHSKKLADMPSRGSVKSNIGHLEGGSGMAGLIKTIMILENGIILPNVNFQNLNPAINADSLHLKVPTDCIPWPSEGLRRASINSFGFGGSNTHVILDDAYHHLEKRGYRATHYTVDKPVELNNNGSLDKPRDSATSEAHLNRHDVIARIDKLIPLQKLFVLSSEDKKGIARLADVVAPYFKSLTFAPSEEEVFLSTIAKRFSSSRSSLSWKSFMIADSLASLGDMSSTIAEPRRARNTGEISFILTGQGAQYHKMGVALCQYATFRDSLRKCERALKHVGCAWSVTDSLSATDPKFDINEPDFAQPLSTVVQIALIDLLFYFGIVPSAVVGHSSGEIAAAYAAGQLTLESACEISYFRGKVTAALKKTSAEGSMLVADISQENVSGYLVECRAQFPDSRVVIACYNSPRNLTLSGSSDAIAYLQREFELNGITASLLRTGVAYHSPVMKGAVSTYGELITNLAKPQESARRVAFFSSVKGELLQDPSILRTADYWNENMTKPVRFSEAVKSMLSRSANAHNEEPSSSNKPITHDLIEIGPHPALRRSVQTIAAENDKINVQYLTVLDRNSPAPESTMSLVGNLYAAGHPIMLDRVNQIGETGVDLTPAVIEALRNLPEYQFDHTRRYWFEAPVSKSTRMRSHARTELLGTPASNSSPHEAIWRKFFDVSETPWLEDHVIDKKIIYPASGMIIMAIEGAKQLASRDRMVLGYLLKDAIFTRPVFINSTERTEVQLSMRPLHRQMEQNGASYDYYIHTRVGDQWLENVRGFIQVQYKRPLHNEEITDDIRQEDEYYQQQYQDMRQACQLNVDINLMYRQLKANGLSYGPSFQCMHDLAWDGKENAMACLEPFQWTTEQSRNSSEEHVIHPATLDAAGQLGWAAITKGGAEVVSSGAATTRIKAAWICGAGASYPEVDSLRTCSTAKLKGSRGFSASVFAVDNKGKLRFWLSHHESTWVSSASQDVEQREYRRICHSMALKPEVAFLTTKQIQAYCGSGQEINTDSAALYDDIEVLLLSYVRKLLETAKSIRIDELKAPAQKYIAWLRDQLAEHESSYASSEQSSILQRSNNSNEVARIASRIHDTSTDSQLCLKTVERFERAIRGSGEPLSSWLSQENIVSYWRGICAPFFQYLRRYLGLLAHKNPSLKILEVGSGPGFMVDEVLSQLVGYNKDGHEISKLSQYMYTESATVSLDEAQAKRTSHTSRLQFKVLDIEANPESQGFPLGTYDVIIAACTIHRAKDLNVALQNAKKLLKTQVQLIKPSDGKLILIEPFESQTLRHGCIFGLFPEWWQSTQDYRKQSPFVPESEWADILVKNGFSGVDILQPDSLPECNKGAALIVSTATTAKVAELQKRIVFIIDHASSLQAKLTELVCQQMGLERNDVEIRTILELPRIDYTDDPSIIFLNDIEGTTLATLDEDKFKALQHLTENTQYLLWVTAGKSDSARTPLLGMLQGFARCLHSERRTLSFVSASLSDHTDHPEAWAIHICNILGTRHWDREELEYHERDGVLQVNRVIHFDELDRAIHEGAHATTKEMELKRDKPLTLEFSKPGFLDSARFVEDHGKYEDLGPYEIEIEVQAIGLGPRDKFVARGKSTGIGCDCSGIVTRVGSQCSTIQPGDRVCAMKIGCFRSYVRCHIQQACKLPETLDLVGASALPSSAATAYYALIVLARLEKTDSVLIHAGAGTTGQMAIQIAKNIGAEIFATVGTPTQKQLLTDSYDIPEDHIFDSRDPSFARSIKCATKERGVDVILNSLTGDSLVASWESIAPFGRFVDIREGDISSDEKLPVMRQRQNVSFLAVAMDQINDERPSLFQSCLTPMMQMLAKGEIHPPSPIREFPVSKLDATLRLMQSRKGDGPLVVTLNARDLVPTCLPRESSYSFPSNASYVIVGGLGGLGRSIVRWMASKGAQNFILLSRSGPKSQAAQDLVRELEEQDVRVETPKCDVSSADALAAALKQCSHLPPVRGCVQGAMVLHDTLFEFMTLEQWQVTIDSKVLSTCNLHEQLPADLDFFIMLASIAGVVGSSTEANYAAGNTFLDAFAAYRRALGLTAVAIDLGWMDDIGILAENVDILARVRNASIKVLSVREIEFLALLEVYCDPALAKAQIAMAKGDHLDIPQSIFTHPQPIVGIVDPSDFRARGVEPPAWMFVGPLGRMLGSDDPYDPSEDSSAANAGKRDWAAQFARATSPEEAKAIVVAGFTERVTWVLTGGEPEKDTAMKIEPDQPLHLYGVDSLVAVELRHWIVQNFATDLTVFDITGSRGVDSIASLVVEKSDLMKSLSQEN